MKDILSSAVHDALLALLQVCAVIALVLLQKVKGKAIDYFNTKTSAAERDWLRLVGNEAFHYAEQAFAHYDGPAKLNEAVKYVLDRAKGKDISVTYPEIRAVIEKAWMEVAAAKP